MMEIEKRCYTVDTLAATLETFEQRYGMDSESFYDTYATCQPVDEIAPFDRVVWADAFCEFTRLKTLPRSVALGRHGALLPAS